MSTEVKRRVHVIARQGRWAVMKEGNTRISKVYSTREAAVKGAKQMAQGSELVIHKKDGSVQRWEKVSS